MEKRGQSSIEYAALLLIFTALAASVWHTFPAAIAHFVDHLNARRSGISGMQP
jgi:hypothetical protein